MPRNLSSAPMGKCSGTGRAPSFSLMEATEA